MVLAVMIAAAAGAAVMGLFARRVRGREVESLRVELELAAARLADCENNCAQRIADKEAACRELLAEKDAACERMIRDKDAQAVFFERAKADIVDKLIKAKYNVVLTDKAKGNAAGKEAENTKAVVAQSAANPRLAPGDYDLVVRCTVSQYYTGKKHVEAHTETVMVPVTTTVLDVTGHMQTITIQEQQVYNIPAGDYPAAFVKARFDVINTKTNQKVWTWEDAREKVADPGISNVKPKEVLTGIMADFSASLRHNLKSRKPKGK
jgi:hypothetical protein